MTENNNLEVEIPLSDTFTLKREDKELILKMTWANLNRCSKYAEENINRFNLYLFDSNMQEDLINLILRETNEKGESEITEKCIYFKNNLTSEEATELYTWVGEHINNFFMRKLVAAEQLREKHLGILANREAFMKKHNETSKDSGEKKD